MSETTQTPDHFAHIPAADAAAIKAVPPEKLRTFATIITRNDARMRIAGDINLPGARQSARIHLDCSPAIYRFDKGAWKSVKL